MITRLSHHLLSVKSVAVEELVQFGGQLFGIRSIFIVQPAPQIVRVALTSEAKRFARLVELLELRTHLIIDQAIACEGRERKAIV